MPHRRSFEWVQPKCKRKKTGRVFDPPHKAHSLKREAPAREQYPGVP